VIELENVSSTSRKCDQEHHSWDNPGMCWQRRVCVRNARCIHGMSLDLWYICHHEEINTFLTYHYVFVVNLFIIIMSSLSTAVYMLFIKNLLLYSRIGNTACFCATISGESCSAGPKKPVQCWSNTHKRWCSETDSGTVVICWNFKLIFCYFVFDTI